MPQFTIKIWELSSRGKEQILEIENFTNRQDAEEFIAHYKSEIKPYKMNKGKLYHEMGAK